MNNLLIFQTECLCSWHTNSYSLRRACVLVFKLKQSKQIKWNFSTHGAVWQLVFPTLNTKGYCVVSWCHTQISLIGFILPTVCNVKFSRYLEEQKCHFQDHSLSGFRWKDLDVSDVQVIVPSSIRHASNIIREDAICNLLTCYTVSELLLLTIYEC